MREAVLSGGCWEAKRASYQWQLALEAFTRGRLLVFFLAHIVALRRGELISRRIRVEEQRLALLRAKTDDNLESTLVFHTSNQSDIIHSP